MGLINVKKYLVILIGILLAAGCHPGSLGGKQISQKSRNYYKGWFGYYYSPGNNTFELGFHPLEVDAETFEVLNSVYAKDTNKVFYTYQILTANPTTFVTLSNEFAKDDKQVFYKGKLLEGADAETFHLNETGVPLDKNHIFVFMEGLSTYRPSPLNLDKNTVKKLYPNQTETSAQRALLQDKNGVYSGGVKLPLDSGSLRKHGSDGYWLDKNGIYSEQWDPNTQQIILYDVTNLKR